MAYDWTRCGTPLEQRRWGRGGGGGLGGGGDGGKNRRKEKQVQHDQCDAIFKDDCEGRVSRKQDIMGEVL